MKSGQPTGKQDRIKVLIIAGSDPVGDWMAEVINQEEGMAFLGMVRDLVQAVESVQKLEPDVILVDVSSGIMDRDDLLNRLSAPVSGASVLVVAMMDEVETVRRAMLHGAQGFLLKPFSEEELIESVQQAHKIKMPPLAPPAEPKSLGPGEEELPRGEVIVVFSPKGGVGSTTIAVNLAVALRTTTNKPVILMDGDLRFGDVDAALNITTNTSIATLLPTLDELEDDYLEDVLVKHSSGIKVLVAPPFVDTADEIKPEQITQLLDRLASLGEGYVVVDAWSSLDDCTLSFLDACHHLVLVTTPQVTAMRDTHRFLEVLNLLDYDPQKTVLVLNNCYQHSSFRMKDVERALGQPIAQVIEHAPSQVTTSLNRGVPLVLEYQNSPVARNIVSLARLLSKKGTAQEGADTRAKQAVPQKKASKRRGFLFRRQTATRTG